METINFITGNPGKIREARAILDIPITQVKISLPEIQHVEVEEVVRCTRRSCQMVSSISGSERTLQNAGWK